MNKFSLATAGIIVAALVTSVSVNAATDTTKTNVTPKGMSCQEFVDLNPQTMAPVAFWVLNEDEDFKGGDYVDFQETETTAVPLAVELCKKIPQSELSKIKDEIKKELSK
ncbi:acid-activated periplasmic chaperone HdeB [Salmonella enterica]|nr:acid-activated periplasmic chaperone HdeB [Salmonella enterica]EEF2063116.1 acid-activated periplasmic chaperone HdeB [Salmonella enterica subsp. enterica serovar Infantis]EEW9696138.1 acid-activated periplasmic chaperone HdeB [Salmonella enterica subsp. enterica serovar Infantis]EFT4060484.1 acid-activated periplasmic chaperone HdeB [Salmonella enterica]EFT4773643.1 acid-activated periplasmic chaperone HdeB [Salmonella enterica]